ncbi:MAG: PH domain-containing protein [Candidatus Njordarchaeota archaeon]
MVNLLKGEKVLESMSPHPISFWPYYVFFLYYIIVGSYMYFKYDELLNSIMGVISIEIIAIIVLVILWWVILIIPALIFSILNIAWKWVILYTFIAVIGTALLAKHVIELQHIWIIATAIGIMGFILTESYRRSHKYIITNKRIIMGSYMGLFGAYERSILYSQITDLTLNQGFLGKIMNYGTIIPLTASGLGTGADTAQVSVGVGAGAEKGGVGAGAGIGVTGGREVTVPRGRSWFVLYGVPDPTRIYNLIEQQRVKREPAQYLQRQVELLEELVEGKEKKEESEE